MKKMSKFAITILSTFAVSSLFAQCPVGSPCHRGYGGGSSYGSGYEAGQGRPSSYGASQPYGGGYSYGSPQYSGGYEGSYYQSPAANYNQGYSQQQSWQHGAHYLNEPAYSHYDNQSTPPPEHPVYPNQQGMMQGSSMQGSPSMDSNWSNQGTPSGSYQTWTQGNPSKSQYSQGSMSNSHLNDSQNWYNSAGAASYNQNWATQPNSAGYSVTTSSEQGAITPAAPKGATATQTPAAGRSDYR